MLALLAAPLAAQIPAEDSRNTRIPDTDTHFSMPQYKTLAEWESRRQQLRRQILFAAGLDPMPGKTPLRPQIFGKLERGDYSIEKVYLETLPGYYLAGNLYRPAGRGGKFPAVAHPHGHWNYGRLEHSPAGSIPARAITLARQGYIGFTYDMVGYNDTVQTPHAFGGPAGQLWSFGPLGLQLWNSIRVLDFLESLPETDRDRLGVTGASGGGTQTFLLAAVDDRVKFSAPVNMISAIMQGGSPCENAPGLRAGTFNVEIGAMMAPRPMLMVSATGDWTRNTPREEFPAIRGIYELYGKSDHLENVHIDAPHNYNQASREAVYRFFGKHILGERTPAKLTERGPRIEKLQDMLVFHGRRLPDNALSYEDLFAAWRRMSTLQLEQTAGLEAIRARLRLALGVEWPGQVVHEDAGRMVLSRPGVGDRIPASWSDGSGAPILVVHPQGQAGARQSPAVAKWEAAKRPLLVIDAFQTGSAVAPRDRARCHFLTFNRTDDQHRVQDILTALAFLRSRHDGAIDLLGLVEAAVWCAFAAAVSPHPVKLLAMPESFQGTDAEFLRVLFAPGIQRAGGWPAARRILGAEPGR